MFIRKKTYERMEKHLKDWERDYDELQDTWRDTCDELRSAKGLNNHNCKIFDDLFNDFTTLDTKYKHIREVLENIRTFGGLLPRHRRSIAAVLDEAPPLKKERLKR